MNKWFLVVAIAVATFTVNAQESVNIEQQKNDSVELDFSDDGIKDFMESTDLIVSAMSPRLDILQNEDGSLAYMFRREGCYLSLRGGFEYRALSSGLHYPGYMVQLGVGYRTKKWDFRAYAGVSHAKYGMLSDKDGYYLSPGLSLETLYDFLPFGAFEENHLKVGLALNYAMKMTYVEQENVKYSSHGATPGASLLFEYERQWWGHGSSLVVGLEVGTDFESGANSNAWGVKAGINLAYRFVVSKKTLKDNRN